MLKPAQDWVRPFLCNQYGHADPDRLQALQVTLRMTNPLSWNNAQTALGSVITRMFESETFALDVLDYALRERKHGDKPSSDLHAILTLGGSVWDVQPADGGRCQLGRRAIGPVAEAIEAVHTTSERAHAHLLAAWGKLMGRNPDPSSAYREAIRAVEVVAAPVVIPGDKQATLGKIIKALRDKPEKWEVDLSEGTTEQVTDMAAMIWQSQLDRHGTHDGTVPLNVSQEQADAAVHIAIALTRMFAGGHIKAV